MVAEFVSADSVKIRALFEEKYPDETYASYLDWFAAKVTDGSIEYISDGQYKVGKYLFE